MRSGLFLLLCLTARPAWPAESSPDQQLVAGRLPCERPQDSRQNGWRQLAWETMKRTSVECDLDFKPVDPERPELFRTPFLVWSCDGPVASLSDTAVSNLRRFLTLGGFLLADDPAGAPTSAFQKSVQEALGRILPGHPLAAIPSDHVLYRTFFLFESAPVGRVQAVRELQGVEVDGRLLVVLSANDLLGALSRDLYGSYEFAVEPGGEAQRESAFRLGINLLFYALCLDYKNDRVHLPFILKRRRL